MTQIAGLANYVGGIGLNQQAYTPYFVGSSQDARKAIAEHIKDGKALTDDDVKKPRDVAAYMGAIKSGKLKLGDAPPSVQKIYKDMKKQGIDPTADPKAVDKYMHDHPGALDAAKKANAETLAKVAAKTDGQLKKDNLDKKVVVADPVKPAGNNAPVPKVQTAKIM